MALMGYASTVNAWDFTWTEDTVPDEYNHGSIERWESWCYNLDSELDWYDQGDLWSDYGWPSNKFLIELWKCVAQVDTVDKVYWDWGRRDSYHSNRDMSDTSSSLRTCSGCSAEVEMIETREMTEEQVTKTDGVEFFATAEELWDESYEWWSEMEWQLVDRELVDGKEEVTTIEEYIETVTTDSFNTPFVYIENAPEWELEITMESDRDEYTAQDPEFNKENGWEVEIEGDNKYVEWEEVEELYYELKVNGVEITREGKNFGSKEELLEYMEESDFFDNLWLDEREKENSINAIQPKLPESENYYLTVLEEEAIEEIVNYEFSKEPEELIRRYYAVYPTENKVASTWEFNFPDEEEVDRDYVVKDYGEIVIKEDMIPLW